MSGFSIAGTGANQFSFQDTNPTTVANGNATTFTVRFTPTSEGAKTATVSFANQDPVKNPYDFTITGTGFAPAIVPSPPTVINPTATSLDVAFNPNGNPASNEFAIQDSINGTFVQADGPRGGTTVWQTAATWGTKTVTGLSTGVTYYFRVKARNGANVETVYGFSTGQNTCSNPTISGTIGTAQQKCQGSTPNAMSSVTLPSE